MRVSVAIGGYAGVDPAGVIEFVQAAETMGVDEVWTAEAWGQDAITPLAFIAGHTSKIKLGTGIMQISARRPSMTAMTALSLNRLSGGRFLLGLGASGPQVVEGLHGVPYKGPLTRLKENVEIIRQAFKGERISYEGTYYTLPLPGGEGKALKVDQPPADIPIYLATLGPKSLEYTGAAADGWLGTTFSPDHAEAHLAHIRKGAEGAGRTLGDIDLHVSCGVEIGDNVEEIIKSKKPQVAFSMGAMGSAKTNFYNEAMQRAGFQDEAKEIQKLWVDGKRKEAAERVPDEMVIQFGAYGTEDMVRQRLKKYSDVGIRSLGLGMGGGSHRDRMEALEQIVDLAKSV
jgi:F420-dependent oxidoreductase-like protein